MVLVAKHEDLISAMIYRRFPKYCDKSKTTKQEKRVGIVCCVVVVVETWLRYRGLLGSWISKVV